MSPSFRHVRAVAPLLFMVLGAGRAASQSAGRPLAVEDYYRVKTVGNPDLSPDGKWVAFTVATRVEATNDNTSEVWLVAADGSSPAKRVSADGVNATGPAWLDDGRLRFASAGRASVLDPAAPDKVTETDAAGGRGAGGGGGRGGRGGGRGGAGGAMASPDGKWTAMVMDTPPPKREKVYESEFAKRHEERFKGVEFDWMDFQRDAAPFPLPNRVDPDVNPPQEIFLTPAGGERKQLTHLGLRPAGANWNRAGTMLAFSADSTYRNENIYGRSDVWTVSTDGRVNKLTSRTDYSYKGAQFSPDGSWILTTRSTPTDAVIA
jgi:dipeptidyl aminopeptidase/acylaminoacyl peptidase